MSDDLNIDAKLDILYKDLEENKGLKSYPRYKLLDIFGLSFRWETIEATLRMRGIFYDAPLGSLITNNGKVRLYLITFPFGKLMAHIKNHSPENDAYLRDLVNVTKENHSPLVLELEEYDGIKTYTMQQLMEFVGATYMDQGVIRDIEQYLEKQAIKHSTLIMYTKAPVRLWLDTYPIAMLLNTVGDLSDTSDEKLRSIAGKL